MSLGPRWTSDLRVREYNPERAPRSKHIRPEEWRRHETRIRALHGKWFDGRKYTHAEMLAELRADCGCTPHCSFNPSYVPKNQIPATCDGKKHGPDMTLDYRAFKWLLKSPLRNVNNAQFNSIPVVIGTNKADFSLSVPLSMLHS